MNASDIQVTSPSPTASAAVRTTQKGAAQPGATQTGATQTGATQTGAAQTGAANDHGFSFHALLSALNPLQYLPIVGTIYRAATGDVIPDPLRYAGSMLVSGLLGGPIGLVSNIAVLIGEKAIGIDPEKIVSGLFHKTPPPAAPTAAAEAPTDAAIRLAWSPRQLAAYGVSLDASGTMHRGELAGADVLNDLELTQIGKAAAAYAAVTLAAPA